MPYAVGRLDVDGSVKACTYSLTGIVGLDAAGHVHGARVPAGGGALRHVILDEHRLLLIGGDVDGEGVARLIVELVDGGDHGVGPRAGRRPECSTCVVTLYMPSRKTRTSVMLAPAGAGERVGGDGDGLGAAAAAGEDDVKRFELVARRLERGARAACPLLRPGESSASPTRSKPTARTPTRRAAS